MVPSTDVVRSASYNINIVMTIALTIALFFAAPIVAVTAPVLAIILWVFAGIYSVTILLAIWLQWLVRSINES